MLKKLRIKFVIINMSFVISILAVVLTIFFFANYRRFQEQTRMIMRQTMEQEEFERQPDKLEFGRRPVDAPPPITPVFVITLEPDENSVKNIWQSNITVSEEMAEDLVSIVQSRDEKKGILKDYSLRYFKANMHGESKIFFADQSYELNSIYSLIRNILLIFVISVSLFFLLSVYLSFSALRPVEQAWKQQNQFIADASHELKTPLTVILANLQILSSHKDSTIKEQDKWLVNTEEEANRMKQLVEELLFLARSDSGNIPESQSAVAVLDFSELILKCSLLFESVAFENKVDLVTDITSGIQISGNEIQLKQMTGVLLDNACKYAEIGGTVTVSLKKTASHAVLSVANTGTLITPEEQKHIFERFYRADKSRARKEGGYGLGLSIARTVVEKHKGKIAVISSKEKGTVFTVTLPL